MEITNHIIPLLTRAYENGISVFLDEGKLKFRLAKGKKADAEIIALLKENKQELIEFLKEELASADDAFLTQGIDRVDRNTVKRIPLSFAQQRLWFIDKFEGSTHYHLPFVQKFGVELDRMILEEALQEIVRRHEVLRTVFIEEKGLPYQYFLAEDNWRLAYEENDKLEDEAALAAYVETAINEPFDLSKDYMMRAKLLKRSNKEQVLIVVLHHIASDAWSNAIFFEELMELYQAKKVGRQARLKTLDIQYADYALWQRNALDEKVLEEKLKYWDEKLRGVEALNLPTDFPRPTIQSIRGASQIFTLPKELSNQVQALARQEGVTLFILLLSVFKILLYKYTGQTDIAVGSPIANRTQAELEHLIGFFVNNLTLRSDLGNHASFLSLLNQVKQTTYDAYSHQDVPFERIVNRVIERRDLSRSPLFQVMFSVGNDSGASTVELSSSKNGTQNGTTNHETNITQGDGNYESAKFDLSFTISENQEGLSVAVLYCRDLFLTSSIARMVEHFELLLSHIVTNPKLNYDKLSLLTPREKALLCAFNKTESDYSKTETVLEAIEAQVQQKPDKTAISFGEEEMSYKELHEKSNQLAAYLHHTEEQSQSLIAVCMDRSMDMIVTLLAVLKSGNAYVPIDPNYPLSRINHIVESARVELVICNRSTLALVQNKEALHCLILEESWTKIKEESRRLTNIDIHRDQLAYILFTSGSTGIPKGVMSTYGNVQAFMHWAKKEFAKSDFEVVFAGTSICFDLSIFEFFYTLSTGKRIRLLENGLNIADYLDQEKSILLNTVPSVMKTLIEQGVDLANVNVITLAGEPIPKFVQNNLDLTRIELRNAYGPTEDTIYSTCYRIKGEEHILIGKPILNTKAYIVDQQFNLVPIGVKGELCLSGDGVSKGYLYQEELTAEKFIAHPFDPEKTTKLYRTGDLVKWLPDGNIDFLGRMDAQVKIRGFRIELGEIESAFEQSSIINEVVVLAKEDHRATKFLVAYISTHVAYDEPSKNELSKHLKSKLPDYMVPNIIVELKKLPLTPNGKVDKKALAAIDTSGMMAKEYLAPRNDLEAQLVAIWEEILELEKIGIHDNFFDLGGHSLLAIRVVSAIRKEHHIDLAIKDLFTHPSIATLANFIYGEGKQSSSNSIGVQQKPERIPLSFAQERLWFIDKMAGSTQYHMPFVQRIVGALDVSILEESIRDLVNRHEVLRTVLIQDQDGVYQQVLAKDQWRLGFQEMELNQGKEELLTSLEQMLTQRFDLEKDHMLRVNLLQFSEKEHLLVLVVHHIASDAWSNTILLNELAEIYEAKKTNRTSQLQDLAIQYSDYAIWQRNYLTKELLEEKLAYWETQLNGAEVLNLPTDFMRPAVQSTKGKQLSRQLDKPLKDELKLLAQEEGVTMFMLVLASFKILLYRYTGQEDISVGTPITNRTHEEMEALIGFFVNTLSLRSDLSENPSIGDLLAQVKATTLEAYQHQDVPFEKIVDRVVKQRDLSRTPLFQVVFAYNTASTFTSNQLIGEESSSAKTKLSRWLEEADISHTAKFDLNLTVSESEEGLNLLVEYCSDLFTEKRMARMLDHFAMILKSIVADRAQRIAEIEMLSSVEEEQLLSKFNTTARAFPEDQTFIDLFAQQVTKYPEELALSYEEENLTYSQLDEKSNQLAHYLKKRGVEANTKVAVCLNRSINLVLSLLAIQKLGAAYIPIDPSYPEVRINYILKDAACSLLICHQDISKLIEEKTSLQCIQISQELQAIAKESTTSLVLVPNPNDLAYVIYTSGSTGYPKGVMIKHATLSNLIHWHIRQYKLSASSRATLMAGVGFDASVWELWPYLAVGASLHIVDDETRLSPKDLLDFYEKAAITHSFLPTGLVPEFVEISRGKKLSLNYLLTGGDSLGAQDIRGLSYRLINNYGPTENTVVATCYELQEEDQFRNPPIGKAIDNVSIYLLDENRNLVPVGIVGEIYIGGKSLASAYLNREELTSQSFIHHALKGKDEIRLYKTGDLARYLPDGNLEFVGRKDSQVKVRGNRIELGEIEAMLKESSLVKDCIVLSKADPLGNNRLVAYIIAHELYDQEGIYHFLKDKLPEYMIPSIMMEVDHFPLTANGKLDKKALPEPDIAALQRTEYLAARNEIEVQLVQLWQEVLQVERLGVLDNFFDLGGHSLLVARVVSAIRKELQLELTIKDLFANPTIELLAIFLEKNAAKSSVAPLAPQERPASVPLSFAQERLWFIDRLEGSIHYHIPLVQTIRGTLDQSILEKSFQAIVNRHEVLRTVFRTEEGQAYQYLLEKNTWHLVYEDASEIKEEEVLSKQVEAFVTKAFELSKDHMFRALLIRRSEREHLLVLVFHHIAADGWSTSIFLRELSALYEAKRLGQELDLQELPIQYMDYAIWQRKHLTGALLETKLNYWEEKLRGASNLDLPLDFVRPAIQSTKGADYSIKLTEAQSERILLFAHQEGVTIFMFFLAAIKLLLSKYAGQKDIVVGTPVANRTQAEIEDLIGFFVNTLALRTTIEGVPNFRALLAQVKANTIEAYNHQDVPFEKVVDRVVAERDMSRTPLFQVLFSLGNDFNESVAPTNFLSEESHGEELELANSQELFSTQISKFDLNFNITENENRFHLRIQYCSDLFLSSTIERMANNFQVLLASILAGPNVALSKLKLLEPREEQQILSEFSFGESITLPQHNLVELFERQAALHPDHIALGFEEATMSYKELNGRANQLARYLQSSGIGQEALVCLCLDRSFEMIIAMLGVMKAGAAYVPIEAEFPKERIDFIVEDTKAKLVICSTGHRILFESYTDLEVLALDESEELNEQARTNLSLKPSASNLAYVIYTSGSTGNPKAVLIEHASIANEIYACAKIFGVQTEDRHLLLASYVFDASLEQIFVPLTSGARLELITKANMLDPIYLENFLEEKAISHFHCTPSFMQTIRPKAYTGLKRICSGGEACPVSLAKSWSPYAKFYNKYGPTEASVSCAYYLYNPDKNYRLATLPIGIPIPNTELYILDENQNFVAIGIVGELYVGGKALARAYLNQSELTKEKFIPSVIDRDKRWYRTGDFVRWNSDGNIEFKGRLDDQVKVRGYRIELGEIRSRLRQHASVEQAAVLVKKDAIGQNNLVAYIVTTNQFDKEVLQSYLKAHLPDYMIPSFLIELETLPKNNSGKVDKKALLQLSLVDDRKNTFVAASNAIEKQLVEIWSSLLSIEKIGIHDNFFELGGHSLLAIRLVSMIRKQFSKEVAIREIFLKSNIYDLAKLIQQAASSSTLAPIEPQERPAKIPLSFSQERLWFIDKLEGSQHYHIPSIYQFGKDLDVDALEFAFREIVNRHEVLRTVFLEEDGMAYQEILAKDQWRLEYEDKKRSDNEKDLQVCIINMVNRRFDLSKDHMLRAKLIETSEDNYVLVFVVHHIASDGWSSQILLKELRDLYEAKQANRSADLAALAIQYADYAIWQRNYLQGTLLDNKLQYWEDKLKQVEVLNLPTDFARPLIQSTKGSQYRLELSDDLFRQAQHLAKAETVTMFMIFLAGAKILLHKYTGQKDITVGSPIANRTQTETEALIGFFVNTLTLRSECDSDISFSKFLHQLKATILEAFEHQEVPFEKIVDRVVVKRDLSRSPLFQVSFSYEEQTEDIQSTEWKDSSAFQMATIEDQTSQDENAGLSAISLQNSKFDLSFALTQTKESLSLVIEYCTDLFLPSTIERMAVHFENILKAAITNVETKIAQLTFLTEAEQEQLLIDFNQTETDFPTDRSSVALFEEQVRLRANHIALRYQDQQITYQELDESANQLANYLRSKGLEQEAIVALSIDHSIEMLIGILGILKAGAAYLPIDIQYPKERVDYILEDSQTSYVLTNSAQKELFTNKSLEVILIDEDWNGISKASKEKAKITISAKHLMYVIYTSGSTGKPKGVMIEHTSNVNMALDQIERFGIQEEDRILQFASISFDASVYEIFMALYAGAQLVIVPKTIIEDSRAFLDYLDLLQVSVVTLPPVYLNILDKERLKSLRVIITAGEAANVSDAVACAAHSDYYNAYGPTECAVCVSTYKVSSADADKTYIPIGKPLANTRIYILDEQKQLVPTNVEGEIYVAGRGLARGYLNKPELTKEKFIEHPFIENARLYKTGDRGKFLADGNIVFLGRKDDQVKIRGHRVELGEVEAVLEQAVGLSSSAVLAKKDALGNYLLVAYLVETEQYDKAQLDAHLKTYLPDYMIPSIFLSLETMPLNTSGKVDRKGLPEPDVSNVSKAAYLAPRNKMEEQLTEIWMDILHLEKIGVHDNFFEIGGHSLLANRVVAAIRKDMQLELLIRDLFLNPSIAALADVLNLQEQNAALPAITPQQRPAKIPLSYAQDRLWFIDKIGGSTHYHMPVVLRFKGELDQESLAYAFNEIINRHEILRTVYYEENGIGYQSILAKNTWALDLKKATGIKDKQDKVALSKLVEPEIIRAFDLSKDHMLRAQLLSLDEKEHLLILVLHHIASDAWSMKILIEELMELYATKMENLPNQLPALPIQYADFSIWQKLHLDEQTFEEKLQYWENKLADVEPINLAVDFPRPAIQSIQGASMSFHIDQEKSEALKKLAKAKGVTMYMLFMSIFKVLLHKYSRQDDICVGSSIANRTQAALEPLIGFFVNTLAIRSDLSGNPSFKTFLGQLKSTVLEAFAHQDVPFEKVVDRVIKGRDRSRSPLFQVLLVLQNQSREEISIQDISSVDLSLESFDYDTSKFDISFFIGESPEGFTTKVVYCSDLFLASTIERFIRHFQNLLSAVIAAPDKNIEALDMLDVVERKAILENFSTATLSYPKEKTLVDWFEEQVALYPENTAVAFEGRSLTYHELNDKANRLAKHLLDTYSIKADDLVGIMMDVSELSIVALLGILKSGAAYVFIDMAYPLDRKSFLIEDTKIKALIIQSDSLFDVIEWNLPIFSIDIQLEELEAVDNNASITRSLNPDDLAYVLYTSGSTGRPKGVQITHRNLMDYLSGLYQHLDPEVNRSFGLMSTMSADLGNTVLFGALMSGGSLHLFSKHSLTNAQQIHRYFEENEIDCIKIVPSHWRALEAEQKILLPQQTIVFGGEKLSTDLIDKIKQEAINLKVINHYGPTETTIGKLLHEVDFTRDYDSIPIGKPFSNTQVYVVDQGDSLVPIGVAGELLIGGHGVARAYLNLPEETQKRFVKNPFLPDDSNELVYRTGDLVCMLPDGNIDFRGRIDDQIKIRGFRVELGEIDKVLQQSPLVETSIVLAQDDAMGNKRLVAYIVATEGFTKEALHSFLASRLPDYMIPAIFLTLEKLPLTANGKINKKALPNPDISSLVNSEYLAPRNEVETQLVLIWKEILGVERVGVLDDFFELGGHSLLAIKVVSAIRQELSIEIAIADLFDYTTIDALAKFLVTKEQERLLPIIVAEERPERIPLSFAQERIWFLDKLGGSKHYHIPFVHRFGADLDQEALAYAFKLIVNRHEVLRTVFKEEDGQAYQEVLAKNEWEMEYEVWTEEEEAFLESLVNSKISSAFDLTKDHKIRASLIQLPGGEYILVVVLHHIASDGWSNPILFKELLEIYKAKLSNRAPALDDLFIQYADYAIWQRKYLEGEVLDQKIQYWEQKLRGVEVLNLPIDLPRPSTQSMRGDHFSFELDEELSVGLRHLAQQEGVTMFMLLLSLLKVLLHKYTGQEDISIGSPVANRTQAELEPLIGFFVNTLSLRTTVNDADRFLDLLASVKTTTLEAYNHQEAPFEKIVERVVDHRDLSRTPLFQVLLSYANKSVSTKAELSSEELDAGENFNYDVSKLDLSFIVADSSERLRVTIAYCTDLFFSTTIERMSRHFQHLVKSVLAQPQVLISEVSILDGEAKAQLLEDFNDTAVDLISDVTSVDLFVQQAQKTPDHIAVIFEDESLSYQDLDERSNQLAHFLRSVGVETETLVTICIDRSVDMIVGIMGILKAGGAYLPVDPDYPQERIDYIVEDSKTTVALTNNKNKSLFKQDENLQLVLIDGDREAIAQEASSLPEQKIGPQHLSYVIYTSGSTGKPKGVMIEHRAKINTILDHIERFRITEKDRISQFVSLAFDASVPEIFMSLFTGAGIVIIPKDKIEDQHLFVKYIKAHQITVCTLPPAYISILDTSIFPAVRVIMTGGDISNLNKVVQLSERRHFFNLYGPTECAVCVSSYLVNKADIAKTQLPIGKPIFNTQIYILDKHRQLVPPNVEGEIYVSGVGLSRGYLHRAELTAEKFVPNPFVTGKKMYKTGDKAKWLLDGNIAFLGRVDDQVKIRGYRIELGEIETVLLQSPVVNDCVILVKEDSTGNKALVAYIIPDESYDSAVQGGIRDFLKAKLPEYMIPSLMKELSVMPLTPNGKIDKKALLAMETSTLLSNEYLAPRDEMETQIAEVWKDLLAVETVGVYDNFFELGGHSLLATRLVAVLGKKLGIEISLRELFEFPTIADQAKLIASSKEESTLKPDRFKENSLMMPLNKIKTDQATIFMLPPILGSSVIYYPLANIFEDYKINCIGFQFKGFDRDEDFHNSIEEIALAYYEELLEYIEDKTEPIYLLGYSMGALVAFELAHLLEQKGMRCDKLIIIDKDAPIKDKWDYNKLKRTVDRKIFKTFNSVDEVKMLMKLHLKEYKLDLPQTELERIRALLIHNEAMIKQYQVGKKKIQTDILTIEAENIKNARKNRMKDWKMFSHGKFEHHYVKSTHFKIMDFHMLPKLVELSYNFLEMEEAKLKGFS